jgi:Flp pilus assembly protein TadG
MLSLCKELCRSRRAVAALEFAIVSVPLMMLVLGTIEFGRLLWTMQALQTTAAEGARCMGILASSCASGGAYSAGNTTSYIESLATDWGVSLTTGDFTTLTRTSTNTACSPTGGTPNVSEVTISYTFNSMVPGLLSMISSKALTGHACYPNDN